MKTIIIITRRYPLMYNTYFQLSTELQMFYLIKHFFYKSFSNFNENLIQQSKVLFLTNVSRK